MNDLSLYLATLSTKQKIKWWLCLPLMVLVFAPLTILVNIGEWAKKIGDLVHKAVFSWIERRKVVTLEQAIAVLKSREELGYTKDGIFYTDLINWLEELKQRRKDSNTEYDMELMRRWEEE